MNCVDSMDDIWFAARKSDDDYDGSITWSDALLPQDATRWS